MITASCGHVLGDDEDIVDVRNGHEICDAIEGFSPCVEYLAYCPACAEKAKAWDTYLPDDVSDEWWFQTGYRQWREKAEAEAALTDYQQNGGVALGDLRKELEI